MPTKQYNGKLNENGEINNVLLFSLLRKRAVREINEPQLAPVHTDFYFLWHQRSCGSKPGVRTAAKAQCRFPRERAGTATGGKVGDAGTRPAVN